MHACINTYANRKLSFDGISVDTEADAAIFNRCSINNKFIAGAFEAGTKRSAYGQPAYTSKSTRQRTRHAGKLAASMPSMFLIIHYSVIEASQAPMQGFESTRLQYYFSQRNAGPP